jgi:hypothetical protein
MDGRTEDEFRNKSLEERTRQIAEAIEELRIEKQARQIAEVFRLGTRLIGPAKQYAALCKPEMTLKEEVGAYLKLRPVLWDYQTRLVKYFEEEHKYAQSGQAVHRLIAMAQDKKLIEQMLFPGVDFKTYDVPFPEAESVFEKLK